MRIMSSFVLSDPNLPDSPIVFASEGFLQMTGYSR
jgi:non-specific serine/threonine protein kinase